MTRTGTEIFYCELKACHPAYYIVSPNRPGDLDEAAHRRLVKRLYVPLPDVFTSKLGKRKSGLKGHFMYRKLLVNKVHLQPFVSLRFFLTTLEIIREFFGKSCVVMLKS